MLFVHEEMAFQFYPEYRTSYRTAFVEPWHFVWIECVGELCRPLLEELAFRGEIPARRVEKTIIQIARKTLSRIREDNEGIIEVKLRRISLLLDLLAWIASTNPSHTNAINFSRFFSRKNGCSPPVYRRNKAFPM